MERDENECQFCGISNEAHESETGKELSVHHIIPRSAGGSNRLENLITVCIPCHSTIEHTQSAALKQLKAEWESDVEDYFDSTESPIDLWLRDNITTTYVVYESSFRTNIIAVTTDRDLALERFEESSCSSGGIEKFRVDVSDHVSENISAMHHGDLVSANFKKHEPIPTVPASEGR